MKISKRLQQIVDLVQKDEKVIDIGADHGYVAITLINNEVTQVADSSELNLNSIKQTRATLRKNKLEHKINLFISDGISGLNLLDYDTIIIAGMGGRKISDIISQKPISHKLILNPNNSIYFLRETLSNLNYMITDEHLVYENKIYNVIIVAQKQSEQIKMSVEDMYLGPVLKTKINQKEVENYYKDLYKKNKILFKKNNKREHKMLMKIYETPFNKLAQEIEE